MVLGLRKFPDWEVVAKLLIPALGRQRLEDLCEFETSLAYRLSSRTGSKDTLRNPVLKTPKNENFVVFPAHLLSPYIHVSTIAETRWSKTMNKSKLNS